MTQKQVAFLKISELVEHFGQQYDANKNSNYNKTLTRRDFIDPFFKVLDWNIDNTQGYAEAYREVMHEDKVQIEGAIEAPEYSFRIGGKNDYSLSKPKNQVSLSKTMCYRLIRYAVKDGMQNLPSALLPTLKNLPFTTVVENQQSQKRHQ